MVPALLKGGKDYAYELLIVQTFGRTVNSFAHHSILLSGNFFFHLFALVFLFIFFSLISCELFSQTYTVKPAAEELKELNSGGIKHIAVYKYDGDSVALGVYLDFWPDVVNNQVNFLTYLEQEKIALMVETKDWQSFDGQLVKKIEKEFEILKFNQNYIIITDYRN